MSDDAADGLAELLERLSRAEKTVAELRTTLLVQEKSELNMLEPLRVRDGHGNTIAELAFEDDSACLTIQQRGGGLCAVRMKAGPEGGELALFHSDGADAVLVRADDGGSTLTLKHRESKSLITLNVDNESARVELRGPDGGRGVQMRADASGCGIELHSVNIEDPVCVLRAEGTGGSITLRASDGSVRTIA